RRQAPYTDRWNTAPQGHRAVLPPLVARWDGELEVPVSGAWRLAVRSSGRAWLRIAGQSLYKDAELESASTVVELAAGRHAIRLEAYDPGVVRTLALCWTPPGGEERPV